jgi:hypothetical protein
MAETSAMGLPLRVRKVPKSCPTGLALPSLGSEFRRIASCWRDFIGLKPNLIQFQPTFMVRMHWHCRATKCEVTVRPPGTRSSLGP